MCEISFFWLAGPQPFPFPSMQSLGQVQFLRVHVSMVCQPKGRALVSLEKLLLRPGGDRGNAHGSPVPFSFSIICLSVLWGLLLEASGWEPCLMWQFCAFYPHPPPPIPPVIPPSSVSQPLVPSLSHLVTGLSPASSRTGCVRNCDRAAILEPALSALLDWSVVSSSAFSS